MLIAVTVMIGSFRQTVNDWVSRAISGDIFFGPAVFSTAAYDQYLPPEVLPELRRDPEVADIYLYRCVRLPFQDRYILVIGGSFDVLARHGGLWFRKGDTQEIMERVGQGPGAGGQGPGVRGQGETGLADSPTPTPYREAERVGAGFKPAPTGPLLQEILTPWPLASLIIPPTPL